MAAMSSPIAAIVHAERGIADLLLNDFAAALNRRGRQVHGLIQQRPDGIKADTALLDLQTGTRYPIFQNLGAGSLSCSIDSGGLAAASLVLRRALDANADLAIANRFGALEATGGGLAAEMLALMAAEIPFLTVVADEYLPAWRHFTGAAGVELPARRAALDDWFANLARRNT